MDFGLYTLLKDIMCCLLIVLRPDKAIKKNSVCFNLLVYENSENVSVCHNPIITETSKDSFSALLQ